jgi:hypothetical protein
VFEILGGQGDAPGCSRPASNGDGGRQSGGSAPDSSGVKGVARTDYSWVGLDVG